MTNIQTIQLQELRCDATARLAELEKGRGKQLKELYHLLTLLQTVKKEVEQGSVKGKSESVKKGEEVHLSRNFALLLDEAVGETQDSESQQQLRDTQTAEMDVNVELGVYKLWNESLEHAASKVEHYAKTGSKKYLAKWQAIQSEDNSLANAYEGQADGPVQSSQSQVQGDASNNQKITQLVGAINTMETMISGMLQSVLA